MYVRVSVVMLRLEYARFRLTHEWKLVNDLVKEKCQWPTSEAMVSEISYHTTNLSDL
jgi:hypothetical protein